MRSKPYLFQTQGIGIALNTPVSSQNWKLCNAAITYSSPGTDWLSQYTDLNGVFRQTSADELRQLNANRQCGESSLFAKQIVNYEVRRHLIECAK